MKRIAIAHNKKTYGLAVVIAAGIVLWLLLRPHSKPNITIIPSKTPQQTITSDKASATNTAASPGSPVNSTPGSKDSGSPASTSTSSASLVAPWGDFVTTHSANTGQNETSACNTTPGASCYIKFTNGNTVYQLSTKTADSNGGVIWNWSVRYLSPGTWQIMAVASLNGVSKSTNDPRVLTVSQ